MYSQRLTNRIEVEQPRCDFKFWSYSSSVLLALASVWPTHAATLTDNFGVSRDYLAAGLGGTIWDGVYFGAGEFANTATGAAGAGATLQCDANTTAPNTLTVRSTATAWEYTEDDGFFLYKVLRGDFSAVVRIVTPYDTGSFNTAGLMARAFAAGGNPFGSSENWVSWTRFDQFSIGNYFRNAVNGGTDRRTKPPSSNYWLRLDRAGNTFTVYERATAGDAWTLMDTQVRTDFAGQPLQVGILHATFNIEREARFADFSITATNFDTFLPEPPPATGLTLTAGTNRNVTISWTPGAGSDGSLVAVWTGAGLVKQRPVNGFTYAGNANFGSGNLLLATNYHVVYVGAGSSVTVTNLPAAANCHVAVFSYAGTGLSTTYSSTPATGSFVSSGQPPATSGYYTFLEVDPTGPPLTNYAGLGEWNTDGNFDGWTLSQITNASVSAGALTGTASGTTPQVSRLNFASGPDLDLGFNNHLELRLQVPADYNGDVVIYYGTTSYTGISGTRTLRIPAVMIPKDGAFHVYRFDLGLEVYWRGFLRDLRIDLFDATGVGKIFALDYLRVGDLTGDVYLPRYTTGNPAPGQLHELGRPVIDMESKHFRFCWDTNVATQSGWNANTARGTLRNLEETWQVFVKKLGYREPAESWNPANRTGQKYKVNMSTWHDGFWAGGEAPGSVAHGRLNITPGGLRVDPPSWVVPHEVMHVFQMHQYPSGAQTVDGTWWEGHANYGRERWLYHYRNLFPNQSGIDANYIQGQHLNVAHGRHYYLSWPFFNYLDENPDGLPDLYDGIVARAWQVTPSGGFFYNTVEQLTTNTPLKELIGFWARRQLTFDYENKAGINAALSSQTPLVWRRYHITELLRRADDTNWWRVPMTIAPVQGAYTIHELIPAGSGAGRVVTVNFRGLPDAARGADWRASFLALSDTNVERYTPLWNAGSNSITLAANENRLYLVVAATPSPMVFTGHSDLTYPYRSHASKQRLHYEVQVFGATPKESDNGSTAGLIQHPNGGGWRASTAVVDATAYIGPNARVLNSAQVRNFARIEDYAVVQNSAQVWDNAVVSGHALVRQNAQIRQNAKVRDWAIVSGTAVVTGTARVLEHAQVRGGTVTDFGTAKGTATYEGGTISQWGMVDGDFLASRNVSNGVAFGHQPFSGVPDNWVRTLPDRIYAQYEFNAAHDSMVRDQTGVTDACLVGNPAWSPSLGGRSGVLSFNGANQYVALDRSLSDLKEITVAAWVRWLGGAPNQPVWHFGSATNNAMFLTPDDGAGNLSFVIRNGGGAQTLKARAALFNGVWTHVAVSLSNNVMGRLYVNGTLQEQGSITITPDQLNAPNTATGAQHNYLARGADNSLPDYNGAVDSVRVYTRALTATEIAALAPANQAPTLAAIPNQTINAGVTLVITNTANDADLPWQTLTFSLDAAPDGATIDSSTGVLSWRPAVAQANTTNTVTVRVTDNGTPTLSATRTFSVIVPPFATPQLLAGRTDGQFLLEVQGDAGPDYSVLASTNLVHWLTLFTTNSPALPFLWSDPDTEIWPYRFYRVQAEP